MKIKKFGSFLIVLALLVCTAAVQVQADKLTGPFFYDFEDFEEFATPGERCRYQYIEVGNQYGTDFASEEIAASSEETFDKDYGRSLLLNVPASGSAPFINLWTELAQNAVIGFSAYTGDDTYFTFSSKGPSNSWSSPDTVSDIIKVISGTLTIKDGTQVSCTAGWNHFCIGLDYTTNKITVWLNGEQVSVYQAAPEFTGTLYFNLNTNRVSGAAQIGIDDMFVYYVADAEITGSDTDGMVEPDITSYTVDMGQKVFGDDLSGAVKIYDSANNLVSGTGSVSSTGYQDTITVPINTTLVPGAEYTVQISGVTDALGNAVSKTLTFSARDTAPKITLGCEETRTLPAGTVIDFTVNAQNLPADDILEVYLGGEKILDLAADTQKFDITLQKGENKVYVKSTSTDVQTQEYVLEAFEYQEIKSYYNGDFETDESMSNLKGTGAMDGSIEVIDLEDEHGKVLKLEVEGSEMPYVLLPSVYGASGIVVLEGDFCFVTLKNRNIFPVKTKDGVWFTKIGEKGAEIQVFGESVAQVEAGEWYHMKVMYDTVSNQVSFFMDGRVYAFEADMGIDNKDGIDYCNQNSGTGSAGSPSILYMDNIREYLVGKPYTYNITLTDAAGSVRDRLPYENGKLNIEFSEAMTEETLAGITLSDENGNIIEPVSIAYDSSRNTYVLEVGTLLPNTAYTITIPATIKTAVGVEGNVGTATVITEKLPFCIDEVTTSEAAGNCTVDVLLQDTTGGGHEASVILCVYEGDRLYDVKVTAVNTANSLTVTEQLNTPTGQYSVEVYLIESLGTMKCIDMYCE